MQAHLPALKLWLNLQCQMIAHTAQAVLIAHAHTPRNHVVAKWPQDTPLDTDITEAARQAITKQRTHLTPQGDSLLMAQPIMLDDALWGAVVLRLENRDPAAVAAALKLLKWGMTWLQFLLHQTQPEPAITSTSATHSLVTSVLKERTLAESAITLVNLLASQLQAQRVGLGLNRGRRVQLQAVSRSASFDSRTPIMQSLSGAMAEALDQRTGVIYPAPENTPLVVRNHEQLAQQAQAAHIYTFILQYGKQTVGALNVEMAKQPLPPEHYQLVESSLPVLAAAFHWQQQAAAGGWQRLGRSVLERVQQWWGRDHWVAKAVAGSALALALLFMIPADYRVQGEATLQSKEKRLLVANQDGYLAEVNARPGDQVTAGSVLAVMDDDELRLERRKLASQLQQYRQTYDNALATGQRAEAAIASAQVEQAAAQLQLVEQQMDRTQLKSPMNGIIVSDDISQSVGAPVQQGDVLFEIAATDGYRVVLYVDERQVAQVNQGAGGKLVLTSKPDEKFEFTVERITPISEVRDGRNYFRVEGALAGDFSRLRPGMTGSGKIDAGRKPLGWIWFHGVFNWLRLALWV